MQYSVPLKLLETETPFSMSKFFSKMRRVKEKMEMINKRERPWCHGWSGAALTLSWQLIQILHVEYTYRQAFLFP